MHDWIGNKCMTPEDGYSSFSLKFIKEAPIEAETDDAEEAINGVEAPICGIRLLSCNSVQAVAGEAGIPFIRNSRRQSTA